MLYTLNGKVKIYGYLMFVTNILAIMSALNVTHLVTWSTQTWESGAKRIFKRVTLCLRACSLNGSFKEVSRSRLLGDNSHNG